MKYPIAETFYSLQGEGVWTGTPMYFVRLAGCNVGKYIADPETADMTTVGTVVGFEDFPLLQKQKHSICTTHQGERFLCDTDYHRTEWLDLLHINAWLKKGTQGIRVDHVCVTGGEPFLYVLDDLVEKMYNSQVMTHIETSGTKPIPKAFREGIWDVWITCCPKEGFLAENYWAPKEWKFLAGPAFDPASVIDFLATGDSRPVFIQPINGVNEPDAEATARVAEIVKAHPQWRLSAQLHKYLKVR